MRREQIKAEPKCWTYDLGDGWAALSGKTDEDNDILSLEVARPNEYWFHSDGCPGSHVVLRAPEEWEGEPPREKLLAAASVAAYHSKARNTKQTKVCYTQARHVSKERGAKAGTVLVNHTKVIKVAPAIPAAPQETK